MKLKHFPEHYKQRVKNMVMPRFKLLVTILLSIIGIGCAQQSFSGASNSLGQETGLRQIIQQGHSSAIVSIAFAPDGRYIISGSVDKTLKLWDVKTGQEIQTFTGHSHTVSSVKFSPDGEQVISGSYDTTLKLWNVKTGQEIRTFIGHSGAINSVAFSPYGKQVLSGSEDKTLKLWDVETGQVIRTFTGHSGAIKSVAFSPDGKQILSGEDTSTLEDMDNLVLHSNNTLKLWDVKTGREIRTFTRHSGAINSVAFSPDGKQALSGSSPSSYKGSQSNLKLWDVETGQELRAFDDDDVESVAFSPDGKQILSSSLDSTKIWDVATAQMILDFSGSSALFSPDGKQILSVEGNTNETLKFWDVATLLRK